MPLQLESAEFDGDIRFSPSRTESGNALSILFDNLTIESGQQDVDPRPQVRRLDGILRCKGDGWVHVDLRGFALSSQPHGYAHIAAWINGRRMTAAPSGPDEPVSASLSAPVKSGELRISLLLLAQRDLTQASTAACGIDSLDFLVIDRRGRRQA